MTEALWTGGIERAPVNPLNRLDYGQYDAACLVVRGDPGPLKCTGLQTGIPMIHPAQCTSGEGFFGNSTAKTVRKGTGFVAICVDFSCSSCYTIG